MNKILKHIPKEILEVGNETFGDVKLFEKWLNRANPFLDGFKPVELLSNEEGREAVLNFLKN